VHWGEPVSHTKETLEAKAFLFNWACFLCDLKKRSQVKIAIGKFGGKN
jgi:hypothetical protein